MVVRRTTTSGFLLTISALLVTGFTCEKAIRLDCESLNTDELPKEDTIGPDADNFELFVTPT